MFYPTYAEIDLGAFKHNLTEVLRYVGKGVKVMAILKADAYGHGLEELAAVSSQSGVYGLGVSDLDEGIKLRELEFSLPVLILAGFWPEQAEEILAYDLSFTVSSIEQIRYLSALGEKRNKEVRVHLKIDTGMNRLGFTPEDLIKDYPEIAGSPKIFIEGIFSHFSTAYSSDEEPFTLNQQAIFQDTLDKINSHQTRQKPLIHLANSAGILKYLQTNYDLVRPGIILYGYLPDAKMKPLLNLKPVMSLKTKILQIKNIKKGESVSYSRIFKAKRDSRIAVLPLGYSLGYSRLLSGHAEVLIQGKRAKQIGIICMDLCMVDITDFSDVKIGEEVVVLGGQGQEKITALDLAGQMGTIPYEVLCNIGNKVPRKYV